jgi:hypothetical protein
MTDDNKRIEFWNFLVTEKNQPRPKGITIQRLAVIKPLLIGSDELWSKVINVHSAANRTASEFYQSNEQAAIHSRTAFWDAVRTIIRQGENKTTQDNARQNTGSKSRRKPISRNRRKQF